MLGVTIPQIGIVVVNRKTSMMGDALSHTSLAGVALGLIFGFNPSLGAIFVCLISAFAIEAMRYRFPQYGDMATAVVMSIGLGAASILSDFTPGGNTLESYLFGSISSATPHDVIASIVLFVVVLFVTLFFYGGLLNISIDPNLARLDGVPVHVINSVFTALTAITVALSAKMVGALWFLPCWLFRRLFFVLSPLYKQMYLVSLTLGLVFMMSGLTLSWYLRDQAGRRHDPHRLPWACCSALCTREEEKSDAKPSFR